MASKLENKVLNISDKISEIFDIASTELEEAKKIKESILDEEPETSKEKQDEWYKRYITSTSEVSLASARFFTARDLKFSFEKMVKQCLIK